MKQLSIQIGGSRIRVQITKSRGEPIFAKISSFLDELSRTRSGSKLSRAFRHLFERANVRGFVGKNLAALVVASSVITPNIAALASTSGDAEINTLVASEAPLSTDVVVQYPVENPHVNQGYQLFHPGVDFEGVTGDAVKPIMAGTVAKIERSRFAYGDSIIVDHENGYSSRYAHLSSMIVREKDFVDTRMIIGAVGATGRATGDHLHLEVYKEGRTVNPLSVLPR